MVLFIIKEKFCGVFFFFEVELDKQICKLLGSLSVR